jgi:hypothetical protein
MYFAEVGPSGTVPPGANSIVAAETPGEVGCMPGLAGLASSSGGGLGDLVGLAQKAYGLATTDWSNPGAVLGAIGGVAGMAGFGDVAQVAGLAQQAHGLLTADWSNPGAAMGGLMGIAGPMLSGSGGLGGLISPGESSGPTGGTPPFMTTGGFAGGNPAQDILTGSRAPVGAGGLPPGLVACSGF